MAFYKVTFAAERVALATILDLLTSAAARGEVSQSFIIEVLPDEKDVLPDASAASVKIVAAAKTTPHAPPKKKRKHGPLHVHEVILKTLRERGPVTKGELVNAIEREGFSPLSFSPALQRARAIALLKKEGGLWSIVSTAAA